MELDVMESSFLRIGVTAPLATIEESDSSDTSEEELEVEGEVEGDQVDGVEKEEGGRLRLSSRRNLPGSCLSLDVARAQAHSR